jgi:hypothetical protein
VAEYDARCSSINAQKKTRRERLAKILFFGALLSTVVSTAFASSHYVELWNPPEAHGQVSSRAAKVPPAPKKHAARARATAAPQKERESMKPVATSMPAQTTPSLPRPTFDDIPRQKTPEGGVLRVRVSSMPVEIQR